MRLRWMMRTVGMFMVVGIFGGCAEQARSRMDIDARADEALRKMSAAIGGAKAFSFRSVATMDEPAATGQLVQVTRENRMVVRRPDRLVVESQQGDDTMFLWYENKALTLLDKVANTYATIGVPGRIDEMLDDIANNYGLTLPLVDLLFSDPYRVLTAETQMGRYVGLHEVDGVKCHHLLLTQETIDWQIWIDAGKEPVPRRFVVDYKSYPGRPEFSAVLRDWNLSAPVGDELFKPTIAKDAKKVELAELFEATETGE